MSEHSDHNSLSDSSSSSNVSGYSDGNLVGQNSDDDFSDYSITQRQTSTVSDIRVPPLDLQRVIVQNTEPDEQQPVIIDSSESDDDDILPTPSSKTVTSQVKSEITPPSNAANAPSFPFGVKSHTSQPPSNFPSTSVGSSNTVPQQHESFNTNSIPKTSGHTSESSSVTNTSTVSNPLPVTQKPAPSLRTLRKTGVAPVQTTQKSQSSKERESNEPTLDALTLFSVFYWINNNCPTVFGSIPVAVELGNPLTMIAMKRLSLAVKECLNHASPSPPQHPEKK
ncbi:hypothetical protein GEMRC1_013868 [Eukaryota sp. GEM-RC1]